MSRFLKVFGLVLALSCMLLAGACKKKVNYYYPSHTNSTMQAGFNEETYVWEGFNFSTNRVNDAK